MTFTNVYLHNSLQDELKDLFSYYEKMLTCDSGALTTTQYGVLINTKFQTIFKFKPKTILQTALHQHVLLHAIKSETMVPGSFDVCLRKLLNYKNSKTPYKENQNILQYHVPTFSDIRNLVTKFTTSNVPSYISDMIIDALDLAGFCGKIVVEKTQLQPHIEHISGYSFSLQPATTTIHDKILEPRIICIDGFIETVAEVHSLFEQVAKTEHICFLFARGMSDEVKHTIKVNFDRGLMKIIPVVVKFDFEGINTLVDIATIAGNDVISSHRGDLISAIKIDDHKIIDRIDVTNKTITLYNSSTKKIVTNHISKLIEKRNDVNEHLSDFLEARIRSLTSNTVFIRLNDDMNYIISSQAIDYVLRAIKTAISYGIIYKTNVIELSTTNLVAENFANKCIKSLNDLGAAVTLTNQN